jgi:cytidyltransferase-like protein
VTEGTRQKLPGTEYRQDGGKPFVFACVEEVPGLDVADYVDYLMLATRLADETLVLIPRKLACGTDSQGLVDDLDKVVMDRELRAVLEVYDNLERARDKTDGSRERLDLIMTAPDSYESANSWNVSRAAGGRRPLAILCHSKSPSQEGPEDHPSQLEPDTRPYKLVSVGGTFNALHAGHHDYLNSALNLAERMHVFISSDRYAEKCKRYRVRGIRYRRRVLESHLRDMGFEDRADIEVLRRVADMPQYLERTKDLDLVLVEQAYYGWFADWNDWRVKCGLSGCDIICRPRAVIGGIELSSTMKSERRDPGSSVGPESIDVLFEI